MFVEVSSILNIFKWNLQYFYNIVSRIGTAKKDKNCNLKKIPASTYYKSIISRITSNRRTANISCQGFDLNNLSNAEIELMLLSLSFSFSDSLSFFFYSISPLLRNSFDSQYLTNFLAKFHNVSRI